MARFSHEADRRDGCTLAVRLPERYLLVGRQSRAPYCRVWPAHCHQVLPEIPVPLASPDPDVPLLLGPLIEAVYERSRNAHRIDYTKPLSPPLAPEQAACLEEPIRGKNRAQSPEEAATKRTAGLSAVGSLSANLLEGEAL